MADEELKKKENVKNTMKKAQKLKDMPIEAVRHITERHDIDYREQFENGQKKKYDTSSRRWKKVPNRNPFPHLRYKWNEFPLICDATRVLFFGRISEHTTFAHFTITNPTSEYFHFKIKCTTNKLFVIKKPCGVLDPHCSETIRVFHLANNLPQPKPFEHYFQIYAMKADPGPLLPSHIVWKELIDEEIVKHRLYAEFFWHPSANRARAGENAKLMLNKKRFNSYDVGGMTYRLRASATDALLNRKLNDDFRREWIPNKKRMEMAKKEKKCINNPRKGQFLLSQPDNIQNIENYLMPRIPEWNDTLNKRYKKVVEDMIEQMNNVEKVMENKEKQKKKSKSKAKSTAKGAKKGKPKEKKNSKATPKTAATKDKK